MFTNFEIETKGDRIEIFGRCIVSGTPVRFDVGANQFRDYFDRGKLIQEAFPDLDPAFREFLVSGIGPVGWRSIFSP